MALITVYIPTKNRRDLLLRALRSVLVQTFDDYEIIVVDDGSEESVEKFIIESIGCSEKVRFIRNSISLGACASRNMAVKEARGKFVTGLDDDDYFHPERLSTLLAEYDSLYSLVSSNYYILTSKGCRRSSYIPRIVGLGSLFNRNCIGNQALIERERFLRVGGFDESLLASQDLDLWIRLVNEFGPAKRIKEPLYYMDTSHDLPRITLSSSRVSGTEGFISKYTGMMSEGQIRYKLESMGSKPERNVIKKVLKGPMYYGAGLSFEIIRNKLRLG